MCILLKLDYAKFVIQFKSYRSKSFGGRSSSPLVQEGLKQNDSSDELSDGQAEGRFRTP